MKKALFYKKINNKIKCDLCHQGCVISDGKFGSCGVRKNIKGVLYSLNYGKVIVQHVDPIEKKPLFHFLPGSLSYSIAALGCNFKCLHCQNADISQVAKHKIKNLEFNQEVLPEQVIENALKAACKSIAYTYTEPTVFYEFALDCMKLARQKGLKNIWVTNGYTGFEALLIAKPYLDAVNVDLKFFTNNSYLKICGAKLRPVLDNLIWYKKNNIWLEVTTLVIPTVNDSKEELKKISEFIYKKLGANIPWHVSAFYPTYKMQNPSPTLKSTIIKAYDIGKSAGLNYVYGGNVIDENMENTYCPKCGEVVIQRIGYQVERRDNNGKCPKCDLTII